MHFPSVPFFSAAAEARSWPTVMASVQFAFSDEVEEYAFIGGEKMPNNAKQDAVDAKADLERLASSKSFRNIVEYFRRNPNDPELLCHECERFGLGDLKWLERVVETWDGEKPLPIPRPHRKRDRYGQESITYFPTERDKGLAGATLRPSEPLIPARGG
jgi:hypothetical protein